MLLKKKKLLNVKYKRKADSVRLLDKQFSIQSRDQFKIGIKGSTYYFTKIDDKGNYQVQVGDQRKFKNISTGGSLRLKHEDGTYIYFDLYSDFVYALDFSLNAYVAMAFCLNLALACFVPDMKTELNRNVASEEIKVDQKRVKDLLKKLEEIKKPKVVEKPKPEPKPEPPKVVEKPKPKVKPIPKPRVVNKPSPVRKPKPKRSVQLTNQKPKPKQKAGPKTVTNNKTPPKRLVVQKGPPKRGGTGPKNPNAKIDQARRAQAKKLAMTNAAAAKLTNIFSQGKNSSFSIPPGAKNAAGRGVAHRGGAGLAGAKNQTGTNFLAKVTGKDVIGSSTGSINTTGSRNIATGAVVTNGEINGVANGKSLNYVQGKVSVSGLHNAGGTGEFGDGPPGIAVKGGSISKDLIRKILEKYAAKIQYCYEKRLIPKPNMKGLLVVRWMILTNGRVQNAKIEKSQLNDEPVHSCVTGIIRGISFLPGPKGGPATVSYPFMFTSSQL